MQFQNNLNARASDIALHFEMLQMNLEQEITTHIIKTKREY
jgi:hypothetical protein